MNPQRNPYPYPSNPYPWWRVGVRVGAAYPRVTRDNPYLWATKEALINPFLDFPTGVQEEVLGILNSRHNQIFSNENLSTGKNLYLSRAYLNPSALQFLYYLRYFMLMQCWPLAVYLTSDLFHVDSSQSPGMEGIEHISTFTTIAMFLVDTAQNEILHGHQEESTKWKGRAGDFKAALLEEMKKYIRQQYPFNNKVNNKNGIIVWWQVLQGSDHAQILSVSAVIFDWHSEVDNSHLLASYNQDVCCSCQFNGWGVYHLCIYVDYPCMSLANERLANGCKNYSATTLYHGN